MEANLSLSQPTKATETPFIICIIHKKAGKKEGRKRSTTRRRRTPCGESRKSPEATRLNILLGSRTINLGTWNVRTMYEAGKTAQVETRQQTTETRNDNLEVLRISETRWTES